MNRIVVEDDILTKTSINKALQITYEDHKNDLDVSCIEIDVIKDTSLELRHISKVENKINIVINVKSNVHLELLEYSYGIKSKVKINYNLDNDSFIKVYKFNECLGMRELNIVNLNGFGSRIDYDLKTICELNEKYDLMFYHRSNNTTANINVNGVSVKEGNLIFNVTNVVYKGMINAQIEQNSRIVLLENNKCQINPNLLIDEYEITANHSAIIGKFSDEEMFYLNSRGIKYNKALNLLIKGFLMKGFNKEIFDENMVLQIIDKYWR